MRWPGAHRIDPVLRDWWPVVLVLVLGQLAGSGPEAGTTPLVLFIIVVAAGLPLRWRREHPALVVSAVSIVVAAHVAAFGGDPPFATFVALMIACAALGQHAATKASFALLVPASAVAAVVVLGPPAPASDLVFPVFYFGAAWGVGRVLRQRQETAQRMAALVAALESERDDKARLAADAERQHIAREVHDVVAHSLGVIAIHAEAADEMLDRGSPGVREPVAVIRDTARNALEELRGVLGAIRAEQPSPRPRLSALPEMAERFRRSGVQLSLEVVGPANAALADAVETTVYRLVQEGLTNALRHARGATVDVTVRSGDEGVFVSIRNTRPASDGVADTSGGGYGLAGMRERVARLGGRFSAGKTDDGGFCVEAHVPLTVPAQ